MSAHQKISFQGFPKWVKSSGQREREKEEQRSVLTMASYAYNRHHRWRTPATWTNNVSNGMWWNNLLWLLASALFDRIARFPLLIPDHEQWTQCSRGETMPKPWIGVWQSLLTGIETSLTCHENTNERFKNKHFTGRLKCQPKEWNFGKIIWAELKFSFNNIETDFVRETILHFNYQIKY